MFGRNFFSGLEEVVARLISFLVSVTFFVIYIAGQGKFDLDWYKAAIVLGFFWILYELISYILFLILSFFSKKTENSLVENQADKINL